VKENSLRTCARHQLYLLKNHVRRAMMADHFMKYFVEASIRLGKNRGMDNYLEHMILGRSPDCVSCRRCKRGGTLKLNYI